MCLLAVLIFICFCHQKLSRFNEEWLNDGNWYRVTVDMGYLLYPQPTEPPMKEWIPRAFHEYYGFCKISSLFLLTSLLSSTATMSSSCSLSLLDEVAL
jgi:hypothetical protein